MPGGGNNEHTAWAFQTVHRLDAFVNFCQNLPRLAAMPDDQVTNSQVNDSDPANNISYISAPINITLSPSPDLYPAPIAPAANGARSIGWMARTAPRRRACAAATRCR
jgi:hypothetical protein